MNRRKHSLFLTLIGLTVALMFGSCNRKAVYSHFAHTTIDGWGWGQTDSLYFDVPPVPEEGVYAPTVGMRCNSSYPFRELVLIVGQQVCPRNVQWEDTISFLLADDEGNYLGQGVNYFQYSLSLPDLYLDKNDSLHVTISHFMKRENLPGIADIGFTLERR